MRLARPCVRVGCFMFLHVNGEETRRLGRPRPHRGTAGGSSHGPRRPIRISRRPNLIPRRSNPAARRANAALWPCGARRRYAPSSLRSRGSPPRPAFAGACCGPRVPFGLRHVPAGLTWAARRSVTNDVHGARSGVGGAVSRAAGPATPEKKKPCACRRRAWCRTWKGKTPRPAARGWCRT